MKLSFTVLLSLTLATLCVVSSPQAKADASHARIVRLSLVQGEVRFAREFHKDSLTDGNAAWEVAPPDGRQAG